MRQPQLLNPLTIKSTLIISASVFWWPISVTRKPWAYSAKAEGSFNFDEATGALSNVKVSIATDSVFTNHKKRDDHLRSADFLNSAEFPEMTFTADNARRSGER
ncbi:MAG: YceI family protein [Candidatus Competibacteraceae bacterium]